jgi:very-short-patch-repair endonuclease
MLRNSALGVKFRRQHVVESFIADFICLQKKLIIEIDGDSHDNKQEYDKWREENLFNIGYKILRFTNDEVIGNGNLVEKRIKEVLNELEG